MGMMGQEKININIEYANKTYLFSMLIPFRDRSIINYACEFAAAMLLKVLGEHIPEFKQELPVA